MDDFSLPKQETSLWDWLRSTRRIFLERLGVLSHVRVGGNGMPEEALLPTPSLEECSILKAGIQGPVKVLTDLLRDGYYQTYSVFAAAHHKTKTIPLGENAVDMWQNHIVPRFEALLKAREEIAANKPLLAYLAREHQTQKRMDAIAARHKGPLVENRVGRADIRPDLAAKVEYEKELLKAYEKRFGIHGSHVASDLRHASVTFPGKEKIHPLEVDLEELRVFIRENFLQKMAQHNFLKPGEKEKIERFEKVEFEKRQRREDTPYQRRMELVERLESDLVKIRARAGQRLVEK